MEATGLPLPGTHCFEHEHTGYGDTQLQVGRVRENMDCDSL